NHEWLGSDASIRTTDSGAGSLGHHCLHSCVASKSEHSAINRQAISDTNARNWRSQMITSFNPPNMSRFQSRALIVGVVALVLLLIGGFVGGRQFLQAYIVGFTFWCGISVGSLALLMLQHLTGGGWGLVIRRVLEAATRTLPLVALLFIPI